ncbi:2-hydroxychromene-2-carboxylate isomerase [Actinobaculum suis]|uniref:2-hydroxychromene-2-carboxylate isomerase n=1 Tax=Actinobaculum suis TaxID=1657 RepID=A0A0K9ESE5_9ACTO|nr:DsbA family protein [Actinobaculum suis]KMY23088.1 DSBA oxidoreductase [Actinobaculum suis]MDY5153975.1 DsbA family protein [Actinobaculum suis]OCA94689.1 disulfide bond formation protein DsbA [Actinobaculum suis]OCA95392.1 disulfide bond formation protein DsbA [Actinobaculum suis]SDE03985.1 2-hydroxychromene-2-carboxylate isomerase [Actinobaculum suis]
MSTRVEFWFDTACPWTWITSRWLQEVAQLRGFEVRWRPFSLDILNEGNKEWQESHLGTGTLREIAQLTMKLAECEGNARLDEFYTNFGRAVYNDGRVFGWEVAAEVLDAMGIPTNYGNDAQRWDNALRESTQEALARVGHEVGVPVIAFDEVAFFGPVISPAPHGQEALDLWDGCVALAKTPGFFELKRSRGEAGPIFD